MSAMVDRRLVDAQLAHVEDMLRDAWVRTEGEAKELISAIASQVQGIISGEWAPPEECGVRAVIHDGNVVHLYGSVPSAKEPEA